MIIGKIIYHNFEPSPMIYRQNTSKMNKISLCREIILGMIFLNIPTYTFSELKEKHGGLSNLHLHIEKKIIGK
jgi:hypothetical protein